MMSVLLVDDEPGSLDLRKLILERHGHMVYCADDVAGAKQIFNAIQPGAIVLDLRLPEANDGLALIRYFREHGPAVRIVVLCGWPLDLEGQPEAEMVDAVLAKPMQFARLVELLESPQNLRE
jgi:DNA-binding response OmpR family regulator